MLPRGQAGVSPAADVSGNWPAADAGTPAECRSEFKSDVLKILGK